MPIYQTATYQVKEAAVDDVKAAIVEFVDLRTRARRRAGRVHRPRARRGQPLALKPSPRLGSGPKLGGPVPIATCGASGSTSVPSDRRPTRLPSHASLLGLARSARPSPDQRDRGMEKGPSSRGDAQNWVPMDHVVQARLRNQITRATMTATTMIVPMPPNPIAAIMLDPSCGCYRRPTRRSG